MASRPVHVIRKPRDWKNLHPAPSHLVEEKACIDCVFGKLDDTGKLLCNMNNKQVAYYDECGAFTRRKEQETE